MFKFKVLFKIIAITLLSKLIKTCISFFSAKLDSKYKILNLMLVKRLLY